jgi:hypothetical protein
MVALAAFSFVVVGLATSIVNARKTGDSSRHLSEATTLALDKLEHLRTLLPASSEMSLGSHTDSGNPMGPDGTAGGIFRRSWVVTGDIPIIGMKRIEMRVRFTDTRGTSTVTLVSYQSLA